jgi:hypothetical protein
MDAGQPRAMRSSSAPPGACSARSRATHALSSRFSPRFSSRFSARQTRAIFPPKKISTRGGVGGADPGARGGRTRGTLKRRTGCPGSAPRCAARPIHPHPRRPPPSALDFNPFKTKKFSDLRHPMTAPHPVGNSYLKHYPSYLDPLTPLLRTGAE